MTDELARRRLGKTEEQPPAADATVYSRHGKYSKWGARPLDPSRPYCVAAYRLDEPDPFDGSTPWLIAWSCWQERPFAAMRTVYDAAVYETARVRVEHKYYGPLRLIVWQKRDDETYRAAPPTDAYALTTGIDTPQESTP